MSSAHDGGHQSPGSGPGDGRGASDGSGAPGLPRASDSAGDPPAGTGGPGGAPGVAAEPSAGGPGGAPGVAAEPGARGASAAGAGVMGVDRGLAWYQALVEQSNDIVVVLEADGAILYASPSASRQLGYRFDDWAGRNAFGAVHPDDQPAVRHAFSELVTRSGQQVPLTFRMVRADGTLLEAEAVATNRLDDPDVGGVVVNIRDIGERNRAERRARAADERYRTLVSSLAEGVMLVDADGIVVLCNEALETMFGVPGRWLIGQPVVTVLEAAAEGGVHLVDQDEQPVPAPRHPLLVALRENRPVHGQRHGVRRPGSAMLWLQISARPVHGPDGAVVGAVASFADVTMERAATVRLRSTLGVLHRERQFLQVLLDNLEEGIVACDQDGRITLLNPASRRFFGIDDDTDLVGRPVTLSGMRHLDGTVMAPSESPLARALAGEVVREVQLLVERPDGLRRTVAANAQVLHDDNGERLGAVVALHDITEQKRTETRLAELALHDPLTGVANRLLLDDRLRRSLARLGRVGGGIGVFMLDLDEFKAVNDTFGHDVGDDVLRSVAQRLAATVRPQDTVARLGGDEFVVVCEVSGGDDEVRTIARRIERALSEPYPVPGATLQVGASVGGVLCDRPGQEPSKVLSSADDAMYRAKAERRVRSSEPPEPGQR